MPIQTSAPSHPDSFPSFMSVFGGLSSRLSDKDKSKDRDSPAPLHPLRVPAAHGSVVAAASRRPFPFHHRTSVSSMTSGSADSSPTTTISTFDSPSVAPDTSPSSSPESPSSMPLSYPKFKSSPRHGESRSAATFRKSPSPSRLRQGSLNQDAPDTTTTTTSSSTTMPTSMPATTTTISSTTATTPPSTATTTTTTTQESPSRRARNLKNLSLRMPPTLDSQPSIATAPLVDSSQHHLSAPASPIMPPKNNRRKPANLTIRTPGFDKSFANEISEVVPPTPAARQSLRHAESSPSLHSVFSPSFGPQGGMQLPRPTTQHAFAPSASSNTRRLSEGCFSPLPTVADENGHGSGVLHDLQEEDDHLDSRESNRRNERGYPNGPVRIYDSGVYLYLEPTAEEASQFDVVVNVAKEVANPFDPKSPDSDTVMSAWRMGDHNQNNASKQESPQTAFSETSFKSALEYPASPEKQRPGPEYIHVEWDHNSEILDDLYPLCELIDGRINENKKVLIHCQLGASRSASLVIAYGLFKNRDLDFNSMYEIVKQRSQWVGPNMSLIYQLTDFRSQLLRGTLAKPSPEEWSMGGTTPKSITTPSVPSTATSPSAIIDHQSSSQAAVSQPSSTSLSPHTNLIPPSPGMGTGSATGTGNTSPGFASHPGFSKTLSHKRSLPPRPLPLRQMYHTAEPADRPQRPRTSYVQPTGKKESFAARDRPEGLPSLFSPRTTEFLAAPVVRPANFGNLNHLNTTTTTTTNPNSNSLDGNLAATMAGDDAFGADPRSPPPGNERFIMRSIDEFL